MRTLVTAGNTQTPIDQVRCITNVFTGRTGGRIAVEAHARGHDVALLTSHPAAVAMPPEPDHRWRILPYRTYEELADSMATLIPREHYDCIVHCAAINDYRVVGTYVPGAGLSFDANDRRWHGGGQLVGVLRGKVKGSHSELWLRLTPTPKLIDKIRTEWGFRGVLVKFKLEVGISAEELLRVAEESRVHSNADLMVANTLEGMHEWAYLGPFDRKYERVERVALAARLLDAIADVAARKRG